MEENYNETPTDAEQIQSTGSGLSGGSGVFSGLSGASDLEGEPLANQPSTDAESSPSPMVEEARSMEETGSLFTDGGATSPHPQYAQYASVSPALSSPGRTMSPFSAKLEPSESVDSMATPITEGTMNMPSLPAASPTSTGSYQSAPRSGRRTSDSATKARIGRSGTSTPGAVAVQPSQPVTSQPPVMSRAEDDAMAKARGASGHQADHEPPQPMVAPGAVAYLPSQPVAPQPSAMSRAEEDAMAKARGARPSRRQGDQEPPQPMMVAPGAVAFQPSQPVAIPQQGSVASQAEEDAIAKARATRPSRRQTQDQPTEPTTPRAQPVLTQAQMDAEAKARARSGTAATALGATAAPHLSPRADPMHTDDSSAMDEMARRREERAQARAERLGVQSSVGAVSVASSQSSREARKIERATAATSPTSVAATSSSTGAHVTSSFANMSEEERQRRYDAKMAQANLQDNERQTPDVQSNKLSSPEKGVVISNLTQEERDRRYDIKMSQADQQHSDNREKRSTSAGPEDDVYAYGRTQPNSMRSPGNLDKTDDFDLMDSSVPITSAADRGMVSDVEYGQANENELAVAIAIDEEEEEEEKFYAYAVEYDPDSKPPLYQNRRCRLYGIVGTVFFIVLVVLLSVTIVVTGKNTNGNDVTTAPTASPTTARDNQYRQYFASKVGEKVYESGTPHFNAVNWIMNEDPMQMEANDPNILQRFMMAFLYFHSSDNGNKPWRSCNPPKEGEDDTCVASEFTRIPPNDTIAFVPRPGATRWLSGQDVCKWEGVLCQGGTAVLGFLLMGQNLTGTLPTELAALPLLQGISVPYNQLTGTIPSEYANLRNLIQLEVHGNLLSGSIPSEFFDKGSMTLQNLNVGDNVLSGQLDSRIGLMTDLKGLHIFENNLMGSFPTEVGNLSFLSFMRVHENEFAGAIPTELANLRQLSELWLQGNTFSGTIPSALGQFPRLQDLRVTGNRLSGTIPTELFNLSKLKYLMLDDLSLTGTLSTLVSQLSDLVILKVSTNQFTGTIPSVISQMNNLGQVWLHYNLFSGQVPNEICGLVPNPLQSLQADCSPVENPSNPCLCCTACCDRDQRICVKNDLTNSG